MDADHALTALRRCDVSPESHLADSAIAPVWHTRCQKAVAEAATKKSGFEEA